MKKINALVLSAVTATFLVGCGGGGGSSSTSGGGLSSTSGGGSSSTSIDYSGSVIDGYIYGATVCLDLDLDGTCSASEPTTKTHTDGTYKLTVTPEQQANKNFNIAPVIAYGGTDNDTGTSFTGILQSQVNGTTANVTPLTTILSKLVQEDVATSPSISKTEMEKKIADKKDVVKKAFNLPADSNIEADFIKDNKIELTKTALQIQKTVDLISQVGSDGSLTDTKILADNIFKSIKDKVKTGSSIDDVLTQTLTATISGVATTDSVIANKLSIGKEQIATIIGNIKTVDSVKDYVDVIENSKTEIKSVADANTITKYTKDTVPSGDTLKITSLKSFLQVLGVGSSISQAKAEALFADGVTKSDLISKFTSKEDANVALQTKYAEIKTLVDTYNAKLEEDAKLKSYAVQAINVIDKINIEKDNIGDKITEAKKLLAGSTENDAIMVQNMLNISNVFSSETANKIVDVKVIGSTDTTLGIGKIIKSTVKDNIIFTPKYTDITENSRTIMHDLATQLKTISDSIGTVFTNKDYVFAYGSESITYDDSLAIRGVILAAAFKLDFIASYSWGTDADIETKNKDINGTNYQYNNISVNPAAVLNNGSFFKLTESARLDTARAYLIEGLELASKLPTGYKDTQDKDRTELTNILNSVKGSGSYELVKQYNEQTGWDSNLNKPTYVTKTEKYYIDLSKLLNSTYAIDVTSLGSDFKMSCNNGMTYSENTSIKHNAALCSYPSYSYYNDGASFLPNVKPTASSSRLDDVIKSIDANGKTLEGQDVIDFLVENM